MGVLYKACYIEKSHYLKQPLSYIHSCLNHGNIALHGAAQKILNLYDIIVSINILRIAKRVPVEHPQFAGENN